MAEQPAVERIRRLAETANVIPIDSNIPIRYCEVLVFILIIVLIRIQCNSIPLLKKYRVRRKVTQFVMYLVLFKVALQIFDPSSLRSY